MSKQRVLILGAGFGGFYACRALIKEANPDIEITIVNKTNVFTFSPLLPESIAKQAMEQAVANKLDDFIDTSKAKLIVAEVNAIDLDSQTVTTSNGSLNYDYLLLALGSKVVYFGTEGAEENCLSLKSFEDINKIRTAIADNLAAARQASDPAEQEKLRTVAIIGAGPTGVELATKINELNEGRNDDEKVKVTIIEKNDNILPSFDHASSVKATAIVRKQSITVRAQSTITSISKDAVHFADNSSLPASIIVWTAGVGANVPAITPEVPVDRSRRLVVDSQLRLVEHNNVFAIGDIASCQNKEQKVLPTLAQVAQKQSKVVAYNIIASIENKPLQEFTFSPKVMVVTLGKWHAIARTDNRGFTGPLVWLASMCLYMLRLPTFSKKMIMLRQLIVAKSDSAEV
jgi:NADH dehydrogenase